MQRALATLAVASAGAAAATFYAHWQQITEKERMHAGVLRDLAREEAAARRMALDAAAALPAGDGSGGACDSGICDLSTKRVRPPVAAASAAAPAV